MGRRAMQVGMATAGIAAVSALGLGIGFASVNRQARPAPSTAPTTIVCPPGAPCELPKEIAKRYAENRHPVPGPDGKIFGWVSNETADRTEPPKTLADLGQVFDANGNVIGYYSADIGVVDKTAVESGTFDLAAAQAKNRTTLTQEDIDKYIAQMRATGVDERILDDMRQQLERKLAKQ